MRQPLRDVPLEEFFAYRTSPSPFRRYLGNCFIRDYDALLFVIPVFILLGSVLLQSFWLPALPVWPFWIVALAYPAYLLFRNARSFFAARNTQCREKTARVRRREADGGAVPFDDARDPRAGDAPEPGGF